VPEVEATPSTRRVARPRELLERRDAAVRSFSLTAQRRARAGARRAPDSVAGRCSDRAGHRRAFAPEEDLDAAPPWHHHDGLWRRRTVRSGIVGRTIQVDGTPEPSSVFCRAAHRSASSSEVRSWLPMRLTSERVNEQSHSYTMLAAWPTA